MVGEPDDETLADTVLVWPRPAWPRSTRTRPSSGRDGFISTRPGASQQGSGTTTAAKIMLSRSDSQNSGSDKCAESLPRPPTGWRYVYDAAGDLRHP